MFTMSSCDGRTILATTKVHVLPSPLFSRSLLTFDPLLAVPFLPVRDDFHPKRNQARQKLATLPTGRFKDLSSDVYYELARRYPEFKEEVYMPTDPYRRVCLFLLCRFQKRQTRPCLQGLTTTTTPPPTSRATRAHLKIGEMTRVMAAAPPARLQETRTPGASPRRTSTLVLTVGGPLKTLRSADALVRAQA